MDIPEMDNEKLQAVNRQGKPSVKTYKKRFYLLQQESRES